MTDLSSEFAGTTAIVTGGASGIGAEVCRKLADLGANVGIADRNTTLASQLAAEIGEAALAVEIDVSDPGSARDAVSRIKEHFGSLTLAVNNAGIVTPRMKMHEVPQADWQFQLAVNLSGVFYCMQAEVPEMLAAGGGAIVNVSSICGLIGVANAAAYTAVKHGVAGLSKAAALDYVHDNIRVNAIAPGYVDTPLMQERSAAERQAIADRHPVKRMAKPSELADAICYLLSPRASFVTGSVMAVDGAYTAV